MSETYDAAVAAIDPASIGKMSREEAGQALQRLTNEFNGQAKVYEALQSKPTDGIGASAKLKALQQDIGWRNKFDRGDPVAHQDFAKLTKMVADTPDSEFARVGIDPGRPTTGTDMPIADQIVAASDMRERGLTRAGITQFLANMGIEAKPDATEISIQTILSDKKPLAETHEQCKAEMKRLTADADWVKRLNAGDPLARTEFLIMSWGVGCYGP